MDDDGELNQYKTTVTILNQEQDRGIFIDSYRFVIYWQATCINCGISMYFFIYNQI